MPVEAHRGVLQSAGTVPGHKIPFCLPPTNHHQIIPWWMSSSAASSARPFGLPDDTDTPIFRIAVVRASGCINISAKVRWSRWRWSSLGFTLFLQLQGFSYWSAVALLHPWCATLTPEVRPVDLDTWFDLNKIENRSFVLKKSVCGFSTLCLRWEELLTGGQLDGQCLSAVYLPASHRRRLLWDVSTHT